MSDIERALESVRRALMAYHEEYGAADALESLAVIEATLREVIGTS